MKIVCWRLFEHSIDRRNDLTNSARWPTVASRGSDALLAQSPSPSRLPYTCSCICKHSLTYMYTEIPMRPMCITQQPQSVSKSVSQSVIVVSVRVFNVSACACVRVHLLDFLHHTQNRVLSLIHHTLTMAYLCEYAIAYLRGVQMH